MEVYKLDWVKEVRGIINQALSEKRNLYEYEAKKLVNILGIPTPKNMFIPIDKLDTIKDIDLNPPYVLKIVSRDIIHKSDVGGVILNVNPEDLMDKTEELISNVKKHVPNAQLEGILIEEMAEKGVETIVGLTRDPQFGPVVMFGLGGIFVEVYRDVSFRLAPLTLDEAIDMIKEVKAYKILSGYRGTPPSDINSLASTIVKIGELGTEINEIKEIDLNPLMAYPDGVLALDVRIILER